MTQVENRLHLRIDGKLTEHTTITYDGAPLGKVKDISYGGILISHDKKDHNFKMDDNLKISLTMLGKSVDAEIVVVYQNKGDLGCSIKHVGVETLLFLREVLEPWRQGNTARVIKKDTNEEDSNKKIYINGEGPVDLILSPNEKGEMSCFLTFLSDGTYKQFSSENSVIKTGEADDSSRLPGSSIRMESKANEKTIRHAKSIMLGMSHNSELSPLLERFL